MLAHELRRRMAALRVVGEAISLLRAQELDPAAMLDLLAREIEDLDDLAQEVLRNHRGGPETGVRTDTDVVAAVRAAATTVAIARGAAIHVDAPPAEVQVKANPTLLRQAIENLLDNAAAHGGPDDVEVGVHTDPAMGQVDVVVADRGAARGTSVAAPDDSRHGIGLFLVRRFLADAGGRSWVSERQGGGTVVCLSLPLPPAAGAAGSDPLVIAVNT